MERTVLHSLQWHLVAHAPLDPHQICFQQHISTQDNLLPIYKDIMQIHNSDPSGNLHKKNIHFVPHSYPLEQNLQRRVRVRTIKFVIDFLSRRTYRIRVGNTRSPNHTNISVPKASVASSMLFNLKIHGIPRRVSQIPHFGCTIYANDTTIWS